MELLLVFALVLFLGVLLSGFMQRSVLSTALLFLVVGAIVGDKALGLVHVQARDPLVIGLAELALFSVLFTDGMHAGLTELRRAWRLPGRALILGMPLTFLGGALLAWGLTPLGWTESMLVAAVLTPTDPVFAAAIVGRQEVPARLRHLLNVESGLNDGLALPVVLILLSFVSSNSSSTLTVLGELGLGVVIGIVVPWLGLQIERLRFFGAAGRYQPLNAFAIGLVVFALCKVTHANAFLAAFAAGSTVATVSPAARASFERFGELIVELFKLAAILTFGALLAPSLFVDAWPKVYVYALLLLLLVRPVAMVLSLLGSRLDRIEWTAAAWFGPKGFASVTYGLLVLQSDAAHRQLMFGIIAIAVAVSIVLHSTSDTVIARVYEEEYAGRSRLVRRARSRRAAYLQQPSDRP
jgi:NhaP-type Na+/H+ or K+/H+ antiporter